jgi:DNA-binding transcriptional regulator GbsR (MarR family)
MNDDNNSNDEDIELPSDVIDRVNLGIIATSLSLYEEGLSLDELIEVTGIRKKDVSKSLDYLIQNRMVRKRTGTGTYFISNFKKMLQFLISSGLMFPLGDQISKTKEEK